MQRVESINGHIGRASRRLDKRSSWLIPKSSPDALVRLFCFPFAGGGANYFFRWAQALSPRVEVCALQQPGKGQRIKELPYRSLNTLVDELVETTPELMDKPAIFFGHSLGAWIAYELACRLSLRPEHMVLSAANPILTKKNVPVHQMDNTDLLEELTILGGTPEAILNDRGFFQQFFPIIRADFEMLETHSPPQHELLDVPASIWSGIEDPRVQSARAFLWASKFSSDVSLKAYRGGHMFINPDQNGDACLQELSKVIDSVVRNSSVATSSGQRSSF